MANTKKAENEIKRTGLYWPGKRTEVERVALPFQVVETVNVSRATREEAPLFAATQGQEAEGWRNKLIWGENKYIMALLLDQGFGGAQPSGFATGHFLRQQAVNCPDRAPPGLQWLVLQKHVHLADFWIIASALGWVVGWHAATAMDKVVAMIAPSETVGLGVLFAVFAAVSGAFTGLALIWLLQRPILKKSELRRTI